MMENIIYVINRYPIGQQMVIEWPDGFKFAGELDTIYETDNGLELEDSAYKEYDASAFLIKKILSHSEESIKRSIQEGELYEVSMEEPSIRLLVNEKVIWEYEE